MTKRIVWLVALLMTLAFPIGAHALNKKLTSKSYIDCRHCLDLPTTEQVIKCTERYM